MTPEQQNSAFLKCQDAIERLENENMAMSEAIKEAQNALKLWPKAGHGEG